MKQGGSWLMSYFMFGTFDLMHNDSFLQHIKAYALERNIYIWFDEEITFYREIHTMLNEQNMSGNIKFAITSKNQPRNSSDVLLPFDKYPSNKLFADESMTFYKHSCRKNINILFECLDEFFAASNLKWIDICVVEGYDDSFRKLELTTGEMKCDLLNQIENTGTLDSSIYRIHR